MKEEILKLRNEGKSYNEIVEILQCSKGTVAYYCGDGQKDKTKARTQARRKNILLAKVDRFKYTKNNSVVEPKDEKTKKDVIESIRKFQKRDNASIGNVNKNIIQTFTWEDVLEKFGEETICYLSGEKINLTKNTYQLDHIIPSSKGGDNTLNNLGITHKIVNSIKSNLTPNELIEWCLKVLKHNGYKVTK